MSNLVNNYLNPFQYLPGSCQLKDETKEKISRVFNSRFIIFSAICSISLGVLYKIEVLSLYSASILAVVFTITVYLKYVFFNQSIKPKKVKELITKQQKLPIMPPPTEAELAKEQEVRVKNYKMLITNGSFANLQDLLELDKSPLKALIAQEQSFLNLAIEVCLAADQQKNNPNPNKHLAVIATLINFGAKVTEQNKTQLHKISKISI